MCVINNIIYKIAFSRNFNQSEKRFCHNFNKSCTLCNVEEKIKLFKSQTRLQISTITSSVVKKKVLKRANKEMFPKSTLVI